MEQNGDSTNELIVKAHQGDEKAREKLILDNTPLIWSIVRRFMGRGLEADDLFQIGVIGLIKAIDNFNTDYAVKLSTYAVPLIMGEIKRFLRDDGLVKVSRTLKENGWKVRKVSESLLKELGREATLEEIAAAAEMPVEDIVVAMEANEEVESIYKSVYQSDGSEVFLVDQVISGANGSGVPVSVGTMARSANGYSGDQEKEHIINHMFLEQLLDKLNEEERKLIKLRYFEEMTQTDVAKELGTSQVQISRMEKKILLRMREQVKI